MRRFGLISVISCLITAMATAGGVLPVGPVINGEFEIALPGKAEVCGVLGSESIQVLPQGLNPHVPDPTSPGDEVPWPWLLSVAPCEAGILKAAQWSSSGVAQFGNWDASADGDREVSIDGSRPFDPAIGAAHNFWQAYNNPQQAWTGNFESIRFRVESGSIPPGAYVQVSFSQSPLGVQHPYVGIFVDCSLTFTGLSASGGTVSRDPVTGNFGSYYSGCDQTAADYAAADEAGKRAILGRLRIVQLSFWGFQTGTPVVLDGVEIVGGTTVGEEVAAGNINVNPSA